MSLVALYADGGVIRVNPSPLGGTWAWAGVDETGTLVTWGSGLITPALVGGPVTNNQTEFAAALFALEAVPAGWAGTLYTDSSITRDRLTGGAALRHLPPSWLTRGAAVLQGLGGRFRVELVRGHPTRRELAAGVSVEGDRVSPWNVWCDAECTRLAQVWLAAQALEVGV